MSIAVVTGASSGMGEEFCRRIDDRGYDEIWMIARRRDRMEEIAGGLRTPCRIIACDLASEARLAELGRTIEAAGPDIGLLVCCAGLGIIGDVDRLSLEDQRTMVDVNVTSLISMVSICVPMMGKGSSIVALCSLSAYVPTSHMTVYSSTKSFVRHYCNGLRRELHPKGIHVLEVSPGWVDTEFIDLCRREGEVPDKVFNGTVTKEQVVDKALRDLDRGRNRSSAGLRTRAITFLGTHLCGVAARTWDGYWR